MHLVEHKLCYSQNLPCTMSSNKLQQARNANHRSKDLINGYIRLQYRGSNTIPIVINYTYGKLLQILSSKQNTDNYNIVEGMKGSWMWNTVYGTVNANENINSVASWKFKSESEFLVIGIVDVMKISNFNKTESFCFSDDGSYGWYGCGELWSNGKFESKDERFKAGDTIKLELNLPQKTLRFYKNDKDINLQIQNIDSTHTYRLAISVFDDTKLHMIDSEFIP